MTSSSLAPSLCTRLRWPDVLHAHLTFDSNVEQQQEQHPSSWMFRLLHTGNLMVLSSCCFPHAAFLLLLLLSANSPAFSSSVPSTVPCGCSSSTSCHLKWSSVPYKHHFSYSFLPLSIKCFSLRKDHITWQAFHRLHPRCSYSWLPTRWQSKLWLQQHHPALQATRFTLNIKLTSIFSDCAYCSTSCMTLPALILDTAWRAYVTMLFYSIIKKDCEIKTVLDKDNYSVI